MVQCFFVHLQVVVLYNIYTIQYIQCYRLNQRVRAESVFLFLLVVLLCIYNTLSDHVTSWEKMPRWYYAPLHTPTHAICGTTAPPRIWQVTLGRVKPHHSVSSAEPTQRFLWKEKGSCMTMIFNNFLSHHHTCRCSACDPDPKCKYWFLTLMPLKDVMMLGAVGAYAWSGTVVHQRGSKVDILPFSAFEAALQDGNHSSLLGRCFMIYSFIGIYSDTLNLCMTQHRKGKVADRHIDLMVFHTDRQRQMWLTSLWVSSEELVWEIVANHFFSHDSVERKKNDNIFCSACTMLGLKVLHAKYTF